MHVSKNLLMHYTRQYCSASCWSFYRSFHRHSYVYAPLTC